MKQNLEETFQGDGLPETLFLQPDQSCIQGLHRSTHDGPELETHPAATEGLSTWGN